MSAIQAFFNQIIELVEANGWQDQLEIQCLEAEELVRVRLSARHPFAPHEIVNEYSCTAHSLEQVQQECLRALRTGSPGI